MQKNFVTIFDKLKAIALKEITEKVVAKATAFTFFHKTAIINPWTYKNLNQKFVIITQK
jgi:hypothetical protein